jgi:DNA polymerase-3 subunit alpha
VTIRGRVDKREEQPRISALDLTLPDLKQIPTGPLVISMEMSRCTPPVIDRMNEILRSHPGGREVHLRLVDGEKKTVLKLDEGLKVTSSPSLSADLKTVLGPDCLVL